MAQLIENTILPKVNPQFIVFPIVTNFTIFNERFVWKL